MNGSSSFPQSNNEAASVDFQRSQPPSGAQLASTSTTTSAPMDMVPGGSMLMFGQNDAILDQLVQQAIAHQNSQHHQTPLSSFFSPAASESPTYYSTSSRRPSASPAGQANLSPLLSTPLDIAPQQPYATSTPLSTSLSPLLAGSLFPNSVRATPLNGSGFVGGPGSPMNTPSSANSSFGYAGISLFPFSSSYTSPIAASPPSANPFAHFGGDLSSFNPYTLGGGNATHGQGHAGPLSSSYYYSPKPELSPTTATLGLSTPIVDAQIAPTYGPTSLPTTELDPSQIQSHLATTHTQSLEERIAQLSDPTQQEEVRAKLAEWTDASSSGPTLRTDENDEEIGEDWKTDEDVIPPALDHPRQRLVVKLLCEWFERRQRPLNADLMQFARPRYGIPNSPLLPTATYLDSSAANAGSSATRPPSRVPAPTGYDCLWPGCTKTLKARTDRVQEEVLNHLNMKPHPCPHEGCGKVYLRGHDLKRHQNKDHSGGKSSRKKGEKEDARRSHAAPHLVGAVARLASTRQKRTRSLRGVEASNVLSSSVASPALTSGSSGLLQAEQSTSVPTVVDSNDALAPFPSLFPNRQDEPQQHQHHDQDFTDASLQDEARSHEDHIRRQQFESNDFVYQSIVTPIPLGEGESDDSYFHSAPAFYQSGRFGTAHQGGSVLQLEMMQSLPRPHPPVYQSYQPQQQQSQAQAHPQMQSQVQHAPYMTYDYRFEGSLQYPVNATTAAAAANSLVQPISTPMIIPPSLPLTTVTSSPSLTRRRLRASTQTRASSVASSSVGMSSEKRTPPKHVLQYISRNALRLGATSSSNPAAETTVASTSARHQHEYMNSGSANAMATTSTSTSYPHFSPSSHTGANAVTQVTPQTQSQAQPQLPSSFSQDFPFFTPEFQHPSQ